LLHPGSSINRRKFLFWAAASLFGLATSTPGAAAIFPSRRSTPGFVALIIDDIGYSRRRAQMFLKLSIPITYAVLPRLALTRPLAAEIYEAGHQLLLHQPMEPVDGRFDPGPGALYVRHEADRIADILKENLDSVVFAVGVNNHMGSLFTASEGKMRTAIEALKAQNRFFVDSVTCRESAGFRTAIWLNVPCARRHVFLDNIREESAIFSRLRCLAQIALQNGCAVGIGHPFPETAAAIGRFFQSPESAPLEPVYISSLLTLPCG